MAGVKGRSGRKPKGYVWPTAVPSVEAPAAADRQAPSADARPTEHHQQAAASKQLTPLAYLLQVVNDPEQPPLTRITAARAAAQYVHLPKKQGGKKDEEQERAASMARGSRFATAAPPKLVASR